MKYAYFSSMGRFFFSVLRGGGDEMGREDTTKRAATAKWLPALGPMCVPEVRHAEWREEVRISFCRLTLHGSDTPMKNDGKQRISLLLTNMFLNLWLLKS